MYFHQTLYTKFCDFIVGLIIVFVFNSPQYPKLNSLSIPEMKIAEYVNSVDLDEEAHIEPPHLDLHCLPFSL